MNLIDQIKNAAAEMFGREFSFREWQLTAIEGIVESVLNHTKHTVMEAPTGSGKSIIAMIAAYTLYKFYSKTSYILVSDLSLFAQYENDIANLKVKCFGCLKGKENYSCLMNTCPVSHSECTLAGITIGKLLHEDIPGFHCKDTCKYVADYRKAIYAPITLMTYQLYYIQRNYVEDSVLSGNNKNFPARDLVVCDECHNLCSICQQHFAPTIDIARPKWMTTLDDYMNWQSTESQRQSIVTNVINAKDNATMLQYASMYARYVNRYCIANEHIRGRFSKHSKLTPRDRAALMAGNHARQEHCKFDDMSDFVTDGSNANHVVRNADAAKITLNFIYDDILLKRYFHTKSECELLMSATIGDFNEYAKLSGLDCSSTNVMRIPSTFDFTRSPIFYSPNDKMSYANKHIALPHIKDEIISICQANQTSQGIIQTGNYENSEFLANSLPDDILSRCIFYTGSKAKNDALEKFIESGLAHGNSILIGPTLIEGLNFPNDMCRFQICMKVPYAHLGSEYIRKKKDLIDGWYKYDAITKICQGIGRGIRYKSDWCKTYILDGCIVNLLDALNDIPTLAGRFSNIGNKLSANISNTI